MPPAPLYSPHRKYSGDEGDAVVVEPRANPRLPAVLLNFLQLLPQSWVVHALHGQESGAKLRADLHSAADFQTSISSGRLRLRLMDDLSLGIRYGPGRTWYNQMLLGPAFWSTFTAPLLLLFELALRSC